MKLVTNTATSGYTSKSMCVGSNVEMYYKVVPTYISHQCITHTCIHGHASGKSLLKFD